MKNPSRAFALALAGYGVIASPAAAQDVDAGQTQFSRQCVACHVVADADGAVLAGRNARTGPNLFGLADRAIASEDGYRYGDALSALGATGETWTAENFTGYVQDPTDWLRGKLGDRRARSKMAYQVRDAQAAQDIFAYLQSLSAD